MAAVIRSGGLLLAQFYLHSWAGTIRRESRVSGARVHRVYADGARLLDPAGVFCQAMAINNLQLLGDHFIQTGQLLKQWNVGERMTAGGPASTTGGARGGASSPSKRRNRARTRTGGARGVLGSQATR